MVTEYSTKHVFRDGILLIILITEMYFLTLLNMSDFMSVKTSAVIFIKHNAGKTLRVKSFPFPPFLRHC